jgi:hypothetical protein
METKSNRHVKFENAAKANLVNTFIQFCLNFYHSHYSFCIISEALGPEHEKLQGCILCVITLLSSRKDSEKETGPLFSTEM